MGIHCFIYTVRKVKGLRYHNSREMSRKIKNVDVFDKAITEAKKSCMLHRHSAVIVHDDEIVSIGHNRVVNFMSHNIGSLHAEMDALMKVKHRGRKFLEECVLIVIRIGPEALGFPLKMSKPCEHCSKEIKKSGIKKVFYSA